MPDKQRKVPGDTTDTRADAGAERKEREKDPSEHNAGGEGLSG